MNLGLGSVMVVYAKSKELCTLLFRGAVITFGRPGSQGKWVYGRVLVR